MNKAVRCYHMRNSDETAGVNAGINNVILKKYHSYKAHTDIVNCVGTYDGRHFSAG